MLVYERELDRSATLALREGGAHFEGRSAVQIALHAITHRLEELGIPYAVVGGMALFLHGYRRFTEDVDILVTREGLEEIHRKLEGRGYLPLFKSSENLRDTNLGVRIEFLVTGEYPGDGRPKPVSFPDPVSEGIEINGIQVLNLDKLIELKLASGKAAHRVRDLGDVQEMIRSLKLPLEVRDRLDPSVRDKYEELWTAIENAPPGPHE